MLRFTLIASSVLVAAASAAAEGSMSTFRTPSGNIQCVLIEGDGGTVVDCEMVSMTKFTLGLKRPADCDLDWGNRFTLSARGRPSMVCYGDTLQGGQSLVLSYGEKIGAAALSCISQKSGLTCKNGSGRGFTLSKTRQRFF